MAKSIIFIIEKYCFKPFLKLMIFILANNNNLLVKQINEFMKKLQSEMN